MPAGARTFGLDETLIEPRVLAPPPTRHALFIFLLVLASILHIGTAGWSEIHNGAEGRYASAARDMFRSGTWTPASPHEPPLLLWLMRGSYQLFGVNPAAARLPIAAAMIASVALTFLIGERLGGYWRGFVAGLVHLCSLGAFIWGRIITPEPLFAMLLAGAIYCALCGYQVQQTRRRWFAGVWIFVALACLTSGVRGLLFPAAILILLALAFREARLRFRQLLHWRYLLLFAALVLPWHLWVRSQNADAAMFLFDSSLDQSLGLRRLALHHLAWWFPVLLLVVPGALLATRRVLRPHEFDFADALPLCWIAVGATMLLFPARQDYHSISIWSAVALAAVWAWDRTPRALRLTGIVLTLLVGIALLCAALCGRLESLPQLPPSPWPSARSVITLIGLAVVLSCLVAGYFAWRNREELALATVMFGMVPIGLGAAEVMARYGPNFSLAQAAQMLEPQLGEAGEVLFEGSANAGSSLGFYLDRKPLFVTEQPFVAGASVPHLSDAEALERMGATHPVYLIIQKGRMPFWQERLTERFHIYHQVGSCGEYVVVNNQP